MSMLINHADKMNNCAAAQFRVSEANIQMWWQQKEKMITVNCTQNCPSY
jgi:hypothetical protein